MAKRTDDEKKTPGADQGAGTDSGSGAGTPPATETLTPIVEAAARFPSSYPLGALRIDNEWLRGTDVSYQKLSVPVPGVFVFDYVPTWGVSTSATSALNRAAFNEFNAIRSQISGNRPYEPNDHMKYRVAVDSLRELYTVIKRAWQCLNNFSATNLYRPEVYLTGMGLDYDDWFTKKSEIYAWLMTNHSALLPFPTVPVGKISARRAGFNTYMFTDGEIDSSQTYIVMQKYFYSYERVDQAEQLTPRVLPSTWNDVKQLWSDMYQALQSSSDVYIIAADIRRAFPNTYITELTAPGSEDEMAPVKKVDTVLRGIMNAAIIGTGSMGNEGGMTAADVGEAFSIQSAENGILYCYPILTWNQTSLKDVNASAYLSHLNSVDADPDAQAYVDMVRFKPVFETLLTRLQGPSTPTVSFTTYVEAMGTEVFVGARILGYNHTGGVQNHKIASFWRRHETTIEVLGELVNFDWHPPVVAITDMDLSEDIPSLPAINAYEFEDVQNYIPVSKSQIKALHDAILLSNFGVQ